MTYIFNKNLNQLFVYTMPYHYINSEVYAMLKQILVAVSYTHLDVYKRQVIHQADLALRNFIF